MEFESTCYSQFSVLNDFQKRLHGTDSNEDKKPFESFGQHNFIKNANAEIGYDKLNRSVMSGSDTDIESKKKHKKIKQNRDNWKCDETLISKSENLDDSEVITQEVEVDKAFLEQISKYSCTEDFYVKLQKKKKHHRELNGSALESLEECSDRNETEDSSVISEIFERPDSSNMGKKRKNKKKRYMQDQTENIKEESDSTENNFVPSGIEESSDDMMKHKRKHHRNKENNLLEHFRRNVEHKIKIENTEYSSEDSANSKCKKKINKFKHSENEVRTRKYFFL